MMTLNPVDWPRTFMPPKPIPPELLALRRENALALFLRWRLREIAQGMPGEDRAFAALLGITGAQWSRVKSGTPVGSKLARQFEQACAVEPGWLDQAHGEPEATGASPGPSDCEPATPAALAAALGLSDGSTAPDSPSQLLMQVHGDSMRELGILDGQWLLVDPALTAGPGDLVLVRSGAECCIRLFGFEDGQARLLAADPACPALHPEDGQPLPVLGVVTASIRRWR